MDHVRYMRAWLRLNTQTDIAQWTDDEVIDSWALLPLPPRVMPDWVAVVNGVNGEPEEPAVEKPDALERLKHTGSHLFKAGIVRIGA